jgi:small subunit ribosomal protein S8
MVNDPIGDMLAQIKNAVMAGKSSVDLPYSRMKHQVAVILLKEGYLTEATKAGEVPKQRLLLKIKYEGKNAVLTDLKRKSKPGLRVYINKTEIPYVIGGMGIAIVSTSQGIMTGKDAKKRGIGGEFLCEVW